MKKLLLGLLFILLTAFTANAEYQPIVYSFGGLNTNSFGVNADQSQFSRLLNFWYSYPDRNNRSFLGLAKVPAVAGSLMTIPNTGRGRGLTQFFYNQSAGMSSYLISSLMPSDYSTCEVYRDSDKLTNQDGSIYSMIANRWEYASSNDVFRGVDSLYMCNGVDFKKYIRDLATQELVLSDVYDVGGTATTISGTMAFTKNSATVTKTAGGSWEAAVKKGAWISSASTSNRVWYEVKYLVSNTTLELRSVYNENTYTTTTAEVAPRSNLVPRFIFNWMGRLWMGSFPISKNSSLMGTGVMGTATMGFSNNGYRQQTLVCSALQTSANPSALENHTGTNTGYIYIGDGSPITGIQSLGNYLFVFKERSYVVYQYNKSTVPPISEAKRFNYGAIGSIVPVGDYLIYFTGKEVRYTNGFTDASMSTDINFDLQQVNYYDNDFNSMYSASENDFYYPTAIYDKSRNYYTLYISPRTNFNRSIDSVRYGYTYDFYTQKWIGVQAITNVGEVINYQNVSQNDNQVAFLPYTRGNSINYFSPRTSFDNATVGTIESVDLAFGDAKHLKKIDWIEFWVHRSPSSSLLYSITLDLNYYADGNLQLSSPLSKTIYPLNLNTNTETTNQIQKIRFNVGTMCNFFRWRLRDVAWGTGATNGFSVVGGIISYQVLNNN